MVHCITFTIYNHIVNILEIFDLGAELTGLIKTVLVLGSSSSDAERLFSLMVNKHYNNSTYVYVVSYRKNNVIQFSRII